MTTQDKLIKKKLSLLELSEFLCIISEGCRINGCSRQHFYDVKQAYEENGIEGFREKSQRFAIIPYERFLEKAGLQM